MRKVNGKIHVLTNVKTDRDSWIPEVECARAEIKSDEREISDGLTNVYMLVPEALVL